MMRALVVFARDRRPAPGDDRDLGRTRKPDTTMVG